MTRALLRIIFTKTGLGTSCACYQNMTWDLLHILFTKTWMGSSCVGSLPKHDWGRPVCSLYQNMNGKLLCIVITENLIGELLWKIFPNHGWCPPVGNTKAYLETSCVWSLPKPDWRPPLHVTKTWFGTFAFTLYQNMTRCLLCILPNMTWDLLHILYIKTWMGFFCVWSLPKHDWPLRQIISKHNLDPPP